MDVLVGILAAASFTLLWSVFFYKRDPHPERIHDITFALGSGAVAFLLSFILVTPFVLGLDVTLEEIDYLFEQRNLLWILILSGAEEAAKLTVLWGIVFKHQKIEGHVGGILYGGLLGLGFAFVENVFYALQLEASLSLIRAVLIPILHSGTGAILGAILSERMLRDNSRHFHNIALTFVAMTVLHALYNYLVLLSGGSPITLLVTLLLWLLLLVLIGYVINLARRRDILPTASSIEKSQETTQEGTTYAILSFVLGFLTLLSIFPLVFGAASIGFAIIAQKNGSRRWGVRAFKFALCSIAISYMTSILQVL